MLRQYQKDACNAVVSWFNYHDTPAIVVVATGGGKSHIIASLADHYSKLGRVLIIAHRKELLQQTGEKITSEVGFYSASLGEKDLSKPITVGGIQSVYDVVSDWQYIFVDECQFLSNNTDDGMYWELINNHPTAKVCGFTATPYRLRGGKLGWGDIIYEINYPALLEMGHLAPLSNKLCDAPDLSTVEVRLGEYVESQLAHIMEDPKLIDAAIRAIAAYSHNRHSCLIFCVSVNHANLITHALNNSGIPASMITGETLQGEREEIIDQFKAEFGDVRYIVNVNVLSVGFDAPNVDMIVCLRPTKSKSLWEQMIGRGVRLAEGKTNCLLIDMAGNLKEHGGLGTPFRDKAKRETTSNCKICPECEEYVKPAIKECPDCGYIWPEPERPKVAHEYEANTYSNTVHSDVITYPVKWVRYKKHLSKKGNETLMVSYGCDHGKYGNVAEWVMKDRLRKFYKDRGNEIGPIEEYSWDDLLWHAESLKQPVKITVDHSKEFPRIIRYEWPTVEQKIEEYLEDGIPY